MKCRECNFCHEVILSKWSPSDECWIKETVQQCWGVKEPFVIEDIDIECTEYPERAELQVEKKYVSNADTIRSMTDKELSWFLWTFDADEVACEDYLLITRKQLMKWLKEPTTI